MAKYWDTLRGRARGEKRSGGSISSFDDWVKAFSFDGVNYPILGVGAGITQDVEQIETNFVAYVHGALKANGVVFACMLTRLMLFSEARFMWQQLDDGRPGDLFHSAELGILETPWPNADTGELLARMIQDVDLAGNFYAVREGSRLRRLRPDWVDIVLTAPPAEAVQSDVAGYVYRPGGTVRSGREQMYGVEEIVHWSPIPDPDAQYRGMSWLTPVIREIQADKAATEHKLKFFDNGATLQTVLTLGETVTPEQFKTWVRKFREAHQGVSNAYEPLFLGGGADAKVIGADLKQLDFKVTQGAGETRIAAAARIHPAILGLSEGLQGSSLNAGNFGAARRVTADGGLRPLWRSGCAAVATVMKVPPTARLWYDGRDIAFLREDMKDLAEIQQMQAITLRNLWDGGAEPESAIAAVVAYDWTLLEHSGNLSVQLQPAEPGQQSEPESGTGGGTGATPGKPPAAVQKQRDVAETLQKVYLAVDKVITAPEARAIANKAGADLELPGPFPATDPSTPAEDTEPDEPAGEPDDEDANEEGD